MNRWPLEWQAVMKTSSTPCHSPYKDTVLISNQTIYSRCQKTGLVQIWTPQTSPVFRHLIISKNKTKLDCVVYCFWKWSSFCPKFRLPASRFQTSPVFGRPDFIYISTIQWMSEIQTFWFQAVPKSKCKPARISAHSDFRHSGLFGTHTKHLDIRVFRFQSVWNLKVPTCTIGF